MIALVGESCSGKSSIQRSLVAAYNYRPLVTYTTRPKRKNETNDIDYHFISYGEFDDLNRQGFFAEVNRYNHWWYGSAREDYTDNSIAVLTPSGLRQVKKQGIKVVSFYIHTTRRERLIRSLERGDDIDEAIRRNLSDVGQFDGLEDETDYTIKDTKASPDEIAMYIDQLYKREVDA